jgi:hypothetical protein
MEKKYTLQAWNPSSDTFFKTERTYEEIIENPFCLNAIDIAKALLDRLREDRGLPSLSTDSFVPEMFKE